MGAFPHDRIWEIGSVPPLHNLFVPAHTLEQISIHSFIEAVKREGNFGHSNPYRNYLRLSLVVSLSRLRRRIYIIALVGIIAIILIRRNARNVVVCDFGKSLLGTDWCTSHFFY